MCVCVHMRQQYPTSDGQKALVTSICFTYSFSASTSSHFLAAVVSFSEPSHLRYNTVASILLAMAVNVIGMEQHNNKSEETEVHCGMGQTENTNTFTNQSSNVLIITQRVK